MKSLNPFIRLLPFIMLTISVLSSLITNTQIYDIIHPFFSQIIGYSLFTNLYFLYFSHRLGMCLYVKLSIWGLISLNIVDFLYPIMLPEYEVYMSIYSDVSSFTFFGLATIYLFIEYGRNRRRGIK